MDITLITIIKQKEYKYLGHTIDNIFLTFSFIIFHILYRCELVIVGTKT